MNRRRRIIVLTAVTCAVAIIFWSLSRDRDPRFVGRWRIVAETDNDAVNVIEFKPDGTGIRQLYSGGQIYPVYQFHWWVVGDCCVLEQEPASTGVPHFKDTLREFIRIITLSQSDRVEWKLRAEHLGDGRIRVWQVDDENGPLGVVKEMVRIEE